MTVGWLLQLINPDGSNRDQDTQGPISPTQNTKLVQPIISSGNIGLGPLPPRDVLQDEDIPPPPPQFIPSNNGFFHRDYDKDLSLPVFSADYPAFFILVLLVTLTTFAMFVLLFLCCLDGDDLVIHLQQDLEAVPPEPEPPFKEVGTETDFSDEPEAPAEMETQTEAAGEEEDTVVIIAAETEPEAATETTDA